MQDYKFLHENRIYILPSNRGFLFLGLVIVFILTAATYNNNLIFILAFFLFSIFIVSAIQTHYNIKGVRLRYVGADETFEGETVSLLFHLTQSRARHKKAIRVRALSKNFKTLKGGYEDLKPFESVKSGRVEVLAWKRGRHKLPSLIVETLYPLGLFRAWKIFRPEAELLVYPKPLANVEIDPSTSELGESELGVRNTPDGDFGELKNYLPGESYHQIAWKQFARSGSLYTKVHWGSEHKHHEIHWSPPKGDIEPYLQKLSGQIKRAFEENASFEIETPDQKVEAGSGVEHARRCWRVLAEVKVGA